MRRTTTAIFACAALLALTLVSPALGGPSLGSIAKTAKQALKTGKQAKRAASGAKRTANSALATANSANGKANQALARPAVTPGGITTVATAVGIAPNDFAVTAAVCPAGQRVISGGVVTVTGAGGTWADQASDDRTAWLGGGEDLGGGGGTATVYAYCVPAGAASVASIDRAAIRAEVAELKRQRAGL
jgi:hypothetical protein